MQQRLMVDDLLQDVRIALRSLLRVPMLAATIVLTVGLITFVFATIIGWAYYGEKAAEYLLGEGAVRPFGEPERAAR